MEYVILDAKLVSRETYVDQVRIFGDFYEKHITRIYFVLKHIGIARERYNEI